MATASSRQFWRAMWQMLRIARRPGGVETLERHLNAMNQETGLTTGLKYCRECGATDFEPVAVGSAEQGKVRVLKLRCRACGAMN